MPERLDDLTASFRRDLRAEGKADRTLVLYAMSVRMFSEWLITHGREPFLNELTRTAIREWLAELVETRAPGTVRTRWRGLHRFCGWLVTEGELPDNPMAGLSTCIPLRAARSAPKIGVVARRRRLSVIVGDRDSAGC